MKNIAYIGSWKHFVFVFVCVWVSLSLYLSFCKSSSRPMSSPDDKLSENIWFVWSKTSNGGDKWKCHAWGHTYRHTYIHTCEYRARILWKQNSQYKKGRLHNIFAYVTVTNLMGFPQCNLKSTLKDDDIQCFVCLICTFRFFTDCPSFSYQRDFLSSSFEDCFILWMASVHCNSP